MCKMRWEETIEYLKKIGSPRSVAESLVAPASSALSNLACQIISPNIGVNEVIYN